MVRKILQFALPLLLIVGGVGAAKVMIKKRPKAGRKKPKKLAMVVDVVRIAPTAHDVVVSGQGVVAPERTVVLQPQVGGVIVHEAEALQIGGRVKKGDVLARIDDRDYKLQVALREADVARAKFEARVERGRRAVAAREWKLLDGSVKATADGKQLALRQPHKARVEASLGAAKTALAAARLNLSRTVIRAPFDAVIRDKRASVGQVVGPGTPIATLVQSDRFLVQASIPLAHLAWLNVPGVNAEQGQGAEATITYEAGGGRKAVRQGRVQRLLGDLDPAGRLARVMIAVQQPLKVETTPKDIAGVQTGDGPRKGAAIASLPLLLGTYVRADIRGKKLNDVFRVPSHAVREGDKVWLVDRDDRLEVRSLPVLWRERDAVVVSGGLQRGDRLVVSRVPSAVPGMQLKPRDVSEGGAPRTAPAKAAGPAKDAPPGNGAGRGPNGPTAPDKPRKQKQRQGGERE